MSMFLYDQSKKELQVYINALYAALRAINDTKIFAKIKGKTLKTNQTVGNFLKLFNNLENQK